MAQPLSVAQVLAEEYQAIGKPAPEEAGDLSGLYHHAHSLPDDDAVTGLCLSGGGIRSATFGLGVMQGLARQGLLRQFDYLSTVSGGGYIGGWLTAWRKHNPPQDPPVMDVLEQPPGDPGAPEPKPIRWLRDYSNYLSPRLGFFSADTWTLVAIFLRNLLLNWLMLLPMLAAILLIPRIAVAFLQEADAGSNLWRASVVAGFLLAAWAISRVPFYLPSLQPAAGPRLQSEAEFVKRYVLPLAGASMLLTTAWFFHQEPLPFRSWILIGVTLHTVSWLFGARQALGKLKPVMWAFIVLGGALGGALVGWLATRPGSLAASPIRYVVFASPLMFALFLLAGAVFSGLASYREMIEDPDREWFARSGGWLLILCVGWILFSATILYGPYLLVWIEQQLGGAFRAWHASAGGVVSGVAAALIGWSSKTPSGDKNSQKLIYRILSQLAEKLMAPLFVLILAASFSLLVSRLLLDKDFDSPIAYLSVLSASAWWHQPAAAAMLFAFGYAIGRLLSVNRFSLHSMYRNRLIRAYLGASRGPQRRPDRLTGFDVHDNVLMDHIPLATKPLHVLNLTLNLTSGEQLAWQKRKAQSFTVSCLHSGYTNSEPGYQPSGDYTDAGGISLGTAMTTSGAAASPNMGYYSSKPLTFIMALFNARLGAWLPNPASSDPKILGQGGPDSPLVLLRETFGLTGRDYNWIYLSDGGHFENLGLYEMVRRRCRWIVVSDASADPTFSFNDLANAIQKIRVDFGVPIEFVKEPDLRPKSKGMSKHCALLQLRYSAVDGEGAPDGMLLYIKPAISEGLSEDVERYSAQHPNFPHQPTSDQFFDEDQFESYRRLGQQSVEKIADGWEVGTLAEFFRHVESHYIGALALFAR